MDIGWTWLILGNTLMYTRHVARVEVAITSDDSLNCTVFIPISIHPILISRPERWCQVCWWLIDWLIDWLMDWLIDWLMDGWIDWWIDWLVDWLIDWLIDGWIDGLMDWWIDGLIDRVWIDFSSILTLQSAQDAEDSDSSVELDTVDYRNEAWSLGLMIIACIGMHNPPFSNPDVPNI